MAESAPAFTGVHFRVRDMARTLGFYRLIGLPIPEGAESEEFVNVGLGGSDRAFAFATHQLTRSYDPGFQPPTGRSAACLQFDLPSREAVDQVHNRLVAAGHPSLLAPFDAFWGSRYAEVADPDGTVVGFQSPVA